MKELILKFGKSSFQYIIEGFVLYKLWMWIIVDTLHISPISLIQAIGLIIIKDFVEVNYSTFKEFEKEDISDDSDYFLFSIIKSLVFLLFGWLIHFFL